MKKVVSFILVIILSMCLVGCDTAQPVQESTTNVITTTDTQPLLDNTDTPDDNESRTIHTLGLSFAFTPNSTWIQNIQLTEVSDNVSEIHYYDSILGSDCTLMISKEAPLSLSQYDFSNSHDQTWQAVEKSVTIKLQQAIQEKVSVATWEYEDFDFAIIGENVNDENAVSCIPKTAIYIINSMAILE